MLKIPKMALMTMLMNRIIVTLRRIIGGIHLLVLEKLKISREVVPVLDRLLGVQIPIQHERAVDPLAIDVFRIKGTPTIPVLSFVTGAIIVTTVNVRGEIVDVTHTVRWRTGLINVLRIRKIIILVYHLQFVYSRNYLRNLVPTSRQVMMVFSITRAKYPSIWEERTSTHLTFHITNVAISSTREVIHHIRVT